MRADRRNAWRAAALALLLVVTVFFVYRAVKGPAEAADPRPATPEALALPASPPDDCLTEVTRPLGLGLKKFTTEDEGVALLPGEMLWPDAETLPEGWTFEEGLYNAGLQDWTIATGPISFTQSTMSASYFTEENPTWVLTVSYLSQFQAFKEPREPHETISLRGQTAYLFQAPFRPTLYSVLWKEGCRVANVVGDLPKDELVAIAEGLQRRSPGDGSATTVAATRVPTAVPTAVATQAP